MNKSKVNQYLGLLGRCVKEQVYNELKTDYGFPNAICKSLTDMFERGNRMDIRPGVSHKSKIVEMYLKSYDFSQIKKLTRHSSESIL